MNNEENDPRAWESTKPPTVMSGLAKSLKMARDKPMTKMQRRRALMMPKAYDDKIDLLPSSIKDGKYVAPTPKYKTKHAEIMENFTKNARKAKKNASSPARPVLKKAWKAARARSRSRSSSSSPGSPGEKAARARARKAQMERDQFDNEGMIGSDQGSGNEDDNLPVFNQSQYEPQYADLALFEQDAEGKPKRTTKIAPLPINMITTERSKDWALNARPAAGDYNAAIKKKIDKLLKSKKKVTRKIPGMKKGSVWDAKQDRWINPNIKERYGSQKSSSSSSSSPKLARCPVGSIRDPDTGRCVLRTGRRGREILKNRSASSSSSTSSGTKATRKKTAAVRKKISAVIRATRTVFKPKTKRSKSVAPPKKGKRLTTKIDKTASRYMQRKYMPAKGNSKLTEQDIQVKKDRAQRKTIPELKTAIKAANKSVSLAGTKSELVERLVNLRIMKHKAMSKKRETLKKMRAMPGSLLLPGSRRKAASSKAASKARIRMRDGRILRSTGRNTPAVTFQPLTVKEWAESKNIAELKVAIKAANEYASLEGSKQVLVARTVNLYETMEANSLPAGYYPQGYLWKKPDKTGRTPGVTWKEGQSGKMEMMYTPKPYQNELVESWQLAPKEVLDPWRHDTNVSAWNTAVKKEIRKLELLSHTMNHSDYLNKVQEKAESLKRVNTKIQVVLMNKLKKTHPRAGQLIRERLTAPRPIRTVVAQTPQRALELRKRNEQLDRIMSIIGHGAARVAPRNVAFVQTIYSETSAVYRRPGQAEEKEFSGGEYTRSSKRMVKFDTADNEAAYHRYITPAPHYERAVAVYKPSTRDYITKRDVKVLNKIDINDVNINHWDNRNKSVGKITLKDVVRTERSTYQTGMVNKHKDNGLFTCEDGVREFAYDARIDLTSVLPEDIDSRVPISFDDVIASQLTDRKIYAEEADKYKLKIRKIQRMEVPETERHEIIGALIRKKLEKVPIRRNEDIIAELERDFQKLKQASRTDKLSYDERKVCSYLYEKARFRLAKYQVTLTEDQEQRIEAFHTLCAKESSSPRSVSPFKVTNVGNKSFTVKNAVSISSGRSSKFGTKSRKSRK